MGEQSDGINYERLEQWQMHASWKKTNLDQLQSL